MHDIWDVIIIGSGPAGSAASIILAKANLKVLMIEKRKLPRYKICSGLISKSCQKVLKEKLGLTVPQVVCTRPRKGKGFKVQFKIGNDFIKIPDRFYNVWRRDFDYWLAIEANEAGTIVEDETKLIDIIENDEITIKVEYKDQRTGETKSKEYFTKYLIGADGGMGITQKQLYPDRKRKTVVVYQEYWTGKLNLDPRYFHAFMDKSLSTNYAWCNFKEDQIIVGVSAQNGGDAKKFHQVFIEFLEESYGLQLNRFIRRMGCFTTDYFSGNIDFKSSLGKNNCLLVGEAANLLNIMGEGVPAAIISGYNAGKAILEHIKQVPPDCQNLVEIYLEKNRKLVDMLTKNWDTFLKQVEEFLKGNQ
ncbi:MAG: NAD(P)/FAD-dependent oxidoreductase [Candidatus Hodarchaeota archaeon]